MAIQSKKIKYSNFLLKNITAISPVVATALLLVVAVVAVVGFQTFFNTYSSGLFSKVETRSSNNLGNTQIENLIGNSLYFKNSGTNNITVTAVKINGVNCNYTGNLSSGITEINVTSCISNLTTSTPDVVIYTSNAVYSEKFYVKSVISSSGSVVAPGLNCSALGLAGGSWIAVPGNSYFGTLDFCVMKYEAKQNTTLPTSTAANTPRNSLNQTDAQIKCTALGSKYHLITNAEWTTIARNAEQIGANWNTSVVGSGFMFSGNSDGWPNNVMSADTNDSNGYYNTFDNLTSCDGFWTNYLSSSDDITTGIACAGQRRTLYLSNSEVIWDLSGNIWEWNNDTCSQGSPWYFAGGGWMEWSDSNLNGTNKEKDLAGPVGDYNSSNGIGWYRQCGGNGYGFYRSGSYNSGYYSGIYTINLAFSTSYTSTALGFRCAYTP